MQKGVIILGCGNRSNAGMDTVTLCICLITIFLFCAFSMNQFTVFHLRIVTHDAVHQLFMIYDTSKLEPIHVHVEPRLAKYS